MRLISESVHDVADPDRVVVRLEVEVSGECLAVTRSAWVGATSFLTVEQYRMERDHVVGRERWHCRQRIMQEIERRIFGCAVTDR